MSHFDRAINLDKHYSVAAYAGKGWLLLKGKETNTNYKEQAIIEFQ